jgi:hypothetical protein
VIWISNLFRALLFVCLSTSSVVAQLQFDEVKDNYSIEDARRGYRFTTASARKFVLQYCRSGYTTEKADVLLPIFERAMAGDINALNAVFNERKFQSGDNEAWSFTTWPLMHAIGDKRFAAYLRTLDPPARAMVFEEVFYLGSLSRPRNPRWLFRT